jgi:hypothetical protein
MWTSFNWSLVYIVLFPVFLLCCWVLSRTIRQTIDEMAAHRIVRDGQGNIPDNRVIHQLLNQELRSNNAVFYFLIFGVAVLTFGGWWSSSGHALLYEQLGREVRDWSTAILLCNRPNLRIPVLIYSFIAYIWMGVALFVYLSCLWLGVIYASFLSTESMERRASRAGTAKVCAATRSILSLRFSRVTPPVS